MFTTENLDLSGKDIKRFWAKVQIGGPDDCWPWLASKTKFGHGVFSVRHEWINAHRVSFFIKNGYLPDNASGRLVMHDCESPPCQNPKHLLDGTTKENGNYPGHRAKQHAKTGVWAGVFGKCHYGRWERKHSPKTKILLSKIALQRERLKREQKLVPRHENLLIFRKPT